MIRWRIEKKEKVETSPLSRMSAAPIPVLVPGQWWETMSIHLCFQSYLLLNFIQFSCSVLDIGSQVETLKSNWYKHHRPSSADWNRLVGLDWNRCDAIEKFGSPWTSCKLQHNFSRQSWPWWYSTCNLLHWSDCGISEAQARSLS